MSDVQSFLVNDNIITKNTEIIDSFIEPHIFENYFIKYRYLLEEDVSCKIIDARYDFRPDLLAFELYGQDFWYPAILIINNISSIFQFKADYLDNRCRIPSVQSINSILTKQRIQAKKKERETT